MGGRRGTKARTVLATAAGCIAVAMFAGGVPAAALQVPSPTVVTLAGNQISPAILDGGIAYQSSVGADGPWDLWFTSWAGVSDATDSGADWQLSPAGSGTMVAYLARPEPTGDPITSDDVVLRDIGAAVSWVISDSETAKERPTLFGTLLYWAENTGGSSGLDVMRYDLAMDSNGNGIPNYREALRPNPDPALSVFAGGAGDQRQPAAGDAGVVWVDGTSIKLRPSSGTTLTLAADAGVSKPSPDTRGALVVWSGKRSGEQDIAVYDTSTGTTTWLGFAGDQDTAPSTDGSSVAWVRGVLPPRKVYVSASNEATVPASAASVDQAMPILRDGVLAWAQAEGGGDVYDVAYTRIISSVPVDRLAGADRYATAVEVSKDTFADGAGVPVVLATGQDFPDALSASGLAGVLRGPVLLTANTSVPSSVMAELARLKCNKVYVIGGESVVSIGVFQQLVSSGYNPERVYGANRYETAVAVAQKMKQLDSTSCQQVFIARGDAYPDALALAPVAYARRGPVLLATSSGLPTATRNAIESIDPVAALVAGGTNVLPATVEAYLSDVGVAAHREAGANRYDTTARITRYAKAQGWSDFAFVGIATGTGFADALSGGAACGYHGGALLLTRPEVLSSEAGSVLDDAGSEIARVVILGSEKAVSPTVEFAIMGHL